MTDILVIEVGIMVKDSKDKKLKESESFFAKDHVMVPVHSKLSVQDKKELLKKYNITLTQLPKMHRTDSAISHLNVKEGDVIKIERKGEEKNIPERKAKESEKKKDGSQPEDAFQGKKQKGEAEEGKKPETWEQKPEKSRDEVPEDPKSDGFPLEQVFFIDSPDSAGQYAETAQIRKEKAGEKEQNLLSSETKSPGLKKTGEASSQGEQAKEKDTDEKYENTGQGKKPLEKKIKKTGESKEAKIEDIPVDEPPEPPPLEKLPGIIAVNKPKDRVLEEKETPQNLSGQRRHGKEKGRIKRDAREKNYIPQIALLGTVVLLLLSSIFYLIFVYLI